MTISATKWKQREDNALFPLQVKNPDFIKAYQRFYSERDKHYVSVGKGGHPHFHPSFDKPESFFLVHMNHDLSVSKNFAGGYLFAIIFVQYLYTKEDGSYVCRKHPFHHMFHRHEMNKDQYLHLPPKTFAESVEHYGDIQTYLPHEPLFNERIVFKLQPEDYHYFKDIFSTFPQFQEQFPMFLSASPPTQLL